MGAPPQEDEEAPAAPASEEALEGLFEMCTRKRRRVAPPNQNPPRAPRKGRLQGGLHPGRETRAPLRFHHERLGDRKGQRLGALGRIQAEYRRQPQLLGERRRGVQHIFQHGGVEGRRIHRLHGGAKARLHTAHLGRFGEDEKRIGRRGRAGRPQVVGGVASGPSMAGGP